MRPPGWYPTGAGFPGCLMTVPPRDMMEGEALDEPLFSASIIPGAGRLVNPKERQEGAGRGQTMTGTSNDEKITTERPQSLTERARAAIGAERDAIETRGGNLVRIAHDAVVELEGGEERTYHARRWYHVTGDAIADNRLDDASLAKVEAEITATGTAELRDTAHGTVLVSKDGDEETEVSVSYVLAPVRLADNRTLTLDVLAAKAAEQGARDGGDDDLADAVRALSDPAYSQDGAVVISSDHDTSKAWGTLVQYREMGTLAAIHCESEAERAAGKQVITYYSLDYDAPGLTYSQPMTEFDKAVSESVFAIRATGARVITARQVWGVLTAADEYARKRGARRPQPRETATSAVAASMSKQIRTLVTMDYSQELRGREVEADGEVITAETAVKTGHMLEAQECKIKSPNGEVIDGYMLSDLVPVFYQHSHAVKQFITVDQSLLADVYGQTGGTTRAVLARNYIIMRVRQLETGHMAQRNILYDTIIKAMNENPSELTRRQRDRCIETIHSVLDGLVDAGAISGWCEYTEERNCSHRRKGVRLTLAHKGIED